MQSTICPNNEELTLDGSYSTPQEKGGRNKIKLIYSNYQVCKIASTKKNVTNQTIRQ